MTEAEWMAATDPTPMLEFLKGKANDRKYLLTSLHACRILWNSVRLPILWTGLTICERQFEGRSSPSEMNRLLKVFANRLDSLLINTSDPGWNGKRNAVMGILLLVDETVARAFGRDTDICGMAGCIIPAEGEGYAHVIRDIFGNPFRPITVNPSWRTSTVVSLASGIYEDRAFDRMPILADALQDAGCDNEDVLNHCRQPGEHCRGCWAVDLVLGKT